MPDELRSGPRQQYRTCYQRPSQPRTAPTDRSVHSTCLGLEPRSSRLFAAAASWLCAHESCHRSIGTGVHSYWFANLTRLHSITAKPGPLQWCAPSLLVRGTTDGQLEQSARFGTTRMAALPLSIYGTHFLVCVYVSYSGLISAASQNHLWPFRDLFFYLFSRLAPDGKKRPKNTFFVILRRASAQARP